MIKFLLLFCCLSGYTQISAWEDSDFNSPLWAVDFSSAVNRVYSIEDRLKKITSILNENFDEDDQDVESIKYHIEHIRYALWGYNSTYFSTHGNLVLYQGEYSRDYDYKIKTR